MSISVDVRASTARFVRHLLEKNCLVRFPNPLAPDIQIHVSWGTRLPNVCTQSGHLAAIKHYKSPIASLIYERPLVGSFKVYHALLGLISFTRCG